MSVSTGRASVASGADTAVEPRTGGAAAQVFLFLRCQVVVVVAPNSFAAFPSGVAQRCQNQPQEGAILARVTRRSCRS